MLAACGGERCSPAVDGDSYVELAGAARMPVLNSERYTGAGALLGANAEIVRMNADVKVDAIVRIDTPFLKVDADRSIELNAGREETFRARDECRIQAWCVLKDALF